MRTSKQRSRSKPNRPRSLGNIVNRVFDSSGPEGKVRGTPQQIIEKYQVLARDAQLSNDRVAAEAFLQHAEHYTRMLGEAQREMQREAEARRDQNGEGQNRENQNRENQSRENQGREGQNRDPESRDGQPREGQGNGAGGDAGQAGQQGSDRRGGQRGQWRRGDERGSERGEERGADRTADTERQPDRPAAAFDEVIDLAADPADGPGLVETPEADMPRKPRGARKEPAPAERSGTRDSSASPVPSGAPSGDAPDGAAETAAPKPRRRAATPRKPRAKPADQSGSGAADGSDTPSASAAE